MTNNEAKQRKVMDEYVRLCGYEQGGDRKSKDHNGLLKLSLDEIASQLGTSKTNLKRALSIERNLTDTGIVTKTTALAIMKELSEEEQLELIDSLDTTKKITGRQIQDYISKNKELEERSV